MVGLEIMTLVQKADENKRTSPVHTDRKQEGQKMEEKKPETKQDQMNKFLGEGLVKKIERADTELIEDDDDDHSQKKLRKGMKKNSSKERLSKSGNKRTLMK